MRVRFFMNAAVAFTFAIFTLSASSVVRAEFETTNGWDGHLFPSYIIATATRKIPEQQATEVDAEDDEKSQDPDGDQDDNQKMDGGKEDDDEEEDDSDDDETILGDENGLLGVTLVADEDEQSVTVSLSCDAVMEPSSLSCTLPKKGVSYTINPKVKYKFEQLSKHSQTGPITVTYTVQSGDKTPEETTEILTLRSINDCPYGRMKDGKFESMRYMFAAYVNEQHPFVDKILREALDTKIVQSFNGYQSKNKSVVYRQVYAIWHALSRRDVRYSNVTKTVALSNVVFSQHVRLIDESINNGQANCVDGSVLLASLLRKIGVEPILVHVPGHCYIGFFLGEDCKAEDFIALETTTIGSKMAGDAPAIEGLDDVVSKEARNDNSWKTFVSALVHGQSNAKEYNEKSEKAAPGSYQLTGVAAARREGVLSIGFSSSQSFTEAASGRRGAKAGDKE